MKLLEIESCYQCTFKLAHTCLCELIQKKVPVSGFHPNCPLPQSESMKRMSEAAMWERPRPATAGGKGMNTETAHVPPLAAPPCSEIPVVLAKELWTQRVHVGGRRYQLKLKIGHQSFSVGDVGTAKTIGWHQSQLAIALARMVNSECVTSAMIERLSHFPNTQDHQRESGESSVRTK